MVDSNSGPVNAIRGIAEGVIGKVKEIIGIALGRREMVAEARAQQDKADAQRDVAKKEAEAAKARGKAKVEEARERAEQQ